MENVNTIENVFTDKVTDLHSNEKMLDSKDVLNDWVSKELFIGRPYNPGTGRGSYMVLDASELLEYQCERQVLYLEPLIRKESILLITGAPGVGKTMFVLGLCKSLVSGENFGNWEVKNRTSVLYVDGELPTYLLQSRLRYFNIVERDFYIFSSSVNREKSFSLRNETFRDEVKKYLAYKEIGVCVFDNISSLAPYLDENSKREWDETNQYLLDLRRYGITSIVIHHTTKNGKEQRGTSGRTDNIDIWLNLETNDHSVSGNLKLRVDYKKWRYEKSDLLNESFILADDYHWTSGNVVRALTEKQQEILKLMNEKLSQSEIARRLAMTQPYISEMKKNFIERGLIDSNSNLTETGLSMIG